MMKVVGLAGRAGSGKSTVARYLAQQPGIEWVDLDTVAWDTYAPGTEVYKGLIDAFGPEILDPSGVIDRRRLAKAAFATETSRGTLDALVHPAVSEAVAAQIQDAEQRHVEILLVEGALLASSSHVDRSVYTCLVWLDASDESRAKRLSDLGRGEHAARGRDAVPWGAFITVTSEGSIADVATRLLKAIHERCPG